MWEGSTALPSGWWESGLPETILTSEGPWISRAKRDPRPRRSFRGVSRARIPSRPAARGPRKRSGPRGRAACGAGLGDRAHPGARKVPRTTPSCREGRAPAPGPRVPGPGRGRRSLRPARAGPVQQSAAPPLTPATPGRGPQSRDAADPVRSRARTERASERAGSGPREPRLGRAGRGLRAGGGSASPRRAARYLHRSSRTLPGTSGRLVSMARPRRGSGASRLRAGSGSGSGPEAGGAGRRRGRGVPRPRPSRARRPMRPRLVARRLQSASERLGGPETHFPPRTGKAALRVRVWARAPGKHPGANSGFVSSPSSATVPAWMEGGDWEAGRKWLKPKSEIFIAPP